MQLFKKLGLMLVMLVMVAQAQQSVVDLFQAASKGDPVAFAQLKALGNKGDADAQVNLGVMYATGEGVPKDLVIAYMWANLAAAQGNFGAKATREALKKEMTPAQIAEGQRLSREWRPKP